MAIQPDHDRLTDYGLIDPSFIAADPTIPFVTENRDLAEAADTESLMAVGRKSGLDEEDEVEDDDETDLEDDDEEDDDLEDDDDEEEDLDEEDDDLEDDDEDDDEDEDEDEDDDEEEEDE